ncbi:HlyD family secretion protein/adhesin transport system membrane fusion protein [Azonexus fungiphilus]|uniref:HlyD family secretion protein/adhesin transport system membrane fusion protein n=1 Tax=Azonexus fungiphilus TaxID=146940 RepID=A0A495WMS3_9RHOO|nr:HlyD family efflux transporter periplasmic adaptor subunit [Azonexus fungiphilus]RKT63131.1 HlyD family secretion protein/adhesin transport system membrane fusion protein [Azonexus fungiphilus]
MRVVSTIRQSQGLIALAAALLAALAGWAAISDIAQIARAPGQVIASARTQVIQSANDGVIEALLVQEGQRVRKGQVLARLDRSQAEAAYQDSLGKVAALKAALVRLQAEVFGRSLVFPESVRSYPAFVANQTELFQRRQKALKAELDALRDNVRLVKEELDLSMPLLGSGDIGKTEIIRLQRQLAELNGQITNRRNKYFQDAQAEMTKAEEDLATQEQTLAERSAIYERTEITAPADGLVKNIQITTPGAKVRPGDVVMELLPTDSALVVEAKLKPADIGFVRQGLPAAIKLDAFDYSVYGVLHGEVSYISPDALSERTQSGDQVFYRAQIRIDEKAMALRNQKSGGHPVSLQPGMTATVEISTGMQTVLAYLTKPITKTLSESLAER